MFNSPSFSLFKAPVSNIIPEGIITLQEVHALIKSSEPYKTRTEELRKMKDEKEAKKYKTTNFDYVTFSGIFSKRKNDSLIQPSGLVVVDLDNLFDTELTKRILLGLTDLETQLLFTSPGGKGLKWVLKANLELYSHKMFFQGISGFLQKTLSLTPDQSGSDITRACFLGYDPDVFINPQLITNE